MNRSRMPTEVKQICCCVSETWTKVIAWFQIVFAALGIVSFILLALGAAHADWTEEDGGKDAKTLIVAILIFTAVICVANLILGVVLLIGNQKEQTSFLWTWIILTAISLGLSVLADVIEAVNGKPAELISAALTLAVTGFMIYVVHRRVREIATARELPAAGKHFTA